MTNASTSGDFPLCGETKHILGAAIRALTQTDALAGLGALLDGGGHAKVAFANAHFLNVAAEDAEFARILDQLVILPDGVGVDIAARLLYGAHFPANLNGTDLVPALLAAHPRPLRVVLMGGRAGIAEKAAHDFATRTPRHRFAVLGHGYFDAAGEAAMLARLEEEPADLLLVAMGNPMQEKWIARCITPRHARVAMGVGALFDFESGSAIRAPTLIRALRLEWVWRLIHEPRRLWKRYVLGNPLFLLRVLRQKVGI